MEKREEKCGTCNAFMRMGPKQGICRALPPVPLFYGMSQTQLKGLGNQSQPVVTAHFPGMMEDGWCRAWQMKTEGEA